MMKPEGGSPATISSVIALCFAGVGWSVAVPYSIHATALSTVGWLLLALALLTGDRTTVTVGAGVLVLGSFVAAGTGASMVSVLVAVTASVLAWDIGQNAISIGHQLGRGAPTARAELTHVLASLVVGTGIVVVGLAATQLVGSSQPIIVVVLFLLAAAVIAIALGPSETLDTARFDQTASTSESSE